MVSTKSISQFGLQFQYWIWTKIVILVVHYFKVQFSHFLTSFWKFSCTDIKKVFFRSYRGSKISHLLVMQLEIFSPYICYCQGDCVFLWKGIQLTYLLSNYTMDYELTFWFVSKCNTHLAETKTNNYRIIFLEFFRYGNFVTQYLSISWCEYVLHFIYYAFLTTHRHVGKYWDRINLTDDWVYYRSFLSVPDQPQFTVCLSIVI